MSSSRDRVSQLCCRNSAVAAFALLLCVMNATAVIAPQKAANAGSVSPARVLLSDVMRKIDMVRARHLVDMDGGVHIDTALVQGLVESDEELCTSLDGPFCQPERKKTISQMQKIVTETTNSLFAGGLTGGVNLKGGGLPSAKIHMLDGKQGDALKDVVNKFKDMTKAREGDKLAKVVIAMFDDKGNLVEVTSGGEKQENKEAAFVFEKAAKRRSDAVQATRQKPTQHGKLANTEQGKATEGNDSSFENLDDLFEIISKQMDNIDHRVDETFKSGDEQLEKVEGALKVMSKEKRALSNQDSNSNENVHSDDLDAFIDDILAQLSASADMAGPGSDREKNDEE